MGSSRREFLKKSSFAAIGALAFSAKSYANIIGSNDRVNAGIVGFSDRFRSSLLPSFLNHNKELNFDVIGVSDLWKKRREEGQAVLKEKFGHGIQGYVNNDALYANKDLDAVIISTADFQHALHTIEAVKAGCDTYTEKPF